MSVKKLLTFIADHCHQEKDRKYLDVLHHHTNMCLPVTASLNVCHFTILIHKMHVRIRAKHYCVGSYTINHLLYSIYVHDAKLSCISLNYTHTCSKSMLTCVARREYMLSEHCDYDGRPALTLELLVQARSVRLWLNVLTLYDRSS